MANHNRTLQLIASKLGLEDEEKVLGKAAEFERLLQTKSVAGSNLSDTSKVVICLDLAAGLFGVSLDLKTAIKYSGLKPPTYNNSKKVVQNLLELDQDRLTIPVLCAALQCTGVQELAEKIVVEYQKQAKMEIDLHHPHYVCMGVFHACRINKVKLSKSKIIEKSRLKPAQWGKLDAEWAKFVDQYFAVAKKKRGRPAKLAEAIVEREEMEVDLPLKEDIQEVQIESYDDWKKRMLEAAYKELRELEKEEKKDKEKIEKKMDFKEMTPRRSPRKTPQKYSPYKSPSKTKGVRLLFPVEL